MQMSVMIKERFADIILPLAVKGKFTYRIPESILPHINTGSGVIIEFGNKKLYTGIVSDIYDIRPDRGSVKDILEILDKGTLVNDLQLKFWSWLAEYYMCSVGEVMKAAVPSGLCPESETLVRSNILFTDHKSLDNAQSFLFNIIENKSPVYIHQLPQIINNRNTFKIVKELILRKAVITSQSIWKRYKPKEEKFIILSKKYTDKELNTILDSLSRAPGQHSFLSTYLRMTNYSSGSDLFPLKQSLILKESGSFPSVVTSLIRKGIIVSVNLEISRLPEIKGGSEPISSLSRKQDEVLKSIKSQSEEKDIILLHGVTSSGKTELYIHLIDEQLRKGRQVLYLLPEIALTTQIIERLRKHFGSHTGVYHSRFNDAEKVEIWNRVAEKNPEDSFNLILGARSALFLPFHNLGLIIVDEEHDGSYKQQDPSPRYHARDSAIMLASLAGAKVLLGSATPSVESYYNTVIGKYGFTELKERYGKVNLPDIMVANTREAYTKKLMVSHFSPQLLKAIDEALLKGEQVILFRNRRGFSPYIECAECGWIPSCTQCAVNLTYHKESNKLICHYCSSVRTIPVKCENCGSISMVTIGYGTEKLEDEIKIIFPDARVTRMDQDTTRGKDSFKRIIESFENNRINILIGTQMISKGLDFENVTVVGILNADSMLNYPDFRSYERAFQLISQVSGRAGRRQKHGRVIIQTSDPENNLIRQVLNNDYIGMFNAQLEERKLFKYPPIYRLIKIIIKHKDRTRLNEFSSMLGNDLRSTFGARILGPEYPLIPRIQLWYIKNILVKLERNKSPVVAKQMINESIERIEMKKGASSLKISIDVDPY